MGNLAYDGNMKIEFTQKQKDILSGFFKDIAVGWFIAAFTIPFTT